MSRTILKNFFYGATAAFFLFPAEPSLLSFWPSALAAYALLIYLCLRNLKGDPFIAFVRIFSLHAGFLFVSRLILYRSVFGILKLYLPNWMQSVSGVLIYAVCFAVYGGVLAGIGHLILAKSTQKRFYLVYPLVALLYAVLEYFNETNFIHTGFVYLGTNGLILAATSALGIFALQTLIFLGCALAGLVLNSKTRRSRAVSCVAVCTVFGSVFLIGYVHKIKAPEKAAWHTAVLVQTDAKFGPYTMVENALWTQTPAAIEKALAENSQIPLDEPVLVVWPENLVINHKEGLEKFLSVQKQLPFKSRHIVGMTGPEGGPLINRVLAIDELGRTIASYDKQVLMPIAEGPLDFPLLPESWRKPVAKVERGSEFAFFQFDDSFNLIPLICFEATQTDFIRRFLRFVRSRSPNPLVAVNVTRDTVYKNTSILDLYALIVRWEAAIHRIPVLRSTSHGYTEVIAPWGEVLARTATSKLEALVARFPVIDAK